MKKINNKTVLITGASHGIGKEVARIFAQKKYRIVINYNKSSESAEKLVTELKNDGIDSMAIKADVSNPIDVKQMIKVAHNFLGHIDVLVNNAGISLYKLFCDTTFEEWNNIFKINVGGIFNCCKEILPKMITQKSGKIINIASILGICGSSMEVAYSASKAAIIGLTKALAKEVGPCNITVNCVSPGVISTKMNKNLSENEIQNLKENTSLLKIGTTKNVADAVFFLASESASYITGQNVQVDGGLII